MRYGMPWQGSKSRIAEQLIGVLPAADTFVDLFAGGCAMTHAALLSGKYKHIIANDMTDSVKCFFAAINGEFDGYAACPSREEWQRERESDIASALLYSFSNDKTGYLWGEELEAVKRPASLMISSGSLWERYQWYRRFIDALKEYLKHCSIEQHRIYELQNAEGMDRLQQLERVSRLQGLQGLQGCRGDYRFVDIPQGATVYADPPYRSTANSSRYGEFDFAAFDQWLAGVDFPVFISEFDAPAGCVEVASFERTTSMSETNTGKVTEKLFVQERFVDSIRLNGQMEIDFI